MGSTPTSTAEAPRTERIDEPPARHALRMPVLPVAVLFAAGIAADHRLGWGLGWGSLPLTTWLAAGLGLSACWGVCHWRGRDRLGLVSLLGACFLLGAGWHHWNWSLTRENEIALFAEETPKPIRLRGRITSEPQIIPRQRELLQAPWDRPDRSACLLECRRIIAADGEIPVRGTARLSLAGHLLHVHTGDEIEFRGRIVLPGGPSNPGEFDYHSYLRRQGIRCTLFAESPEAVERLSAVHPYSFSRIISRLRQQAESLFVRHLNPENAALASALLLGSRANLPDDVQNAFAASGTMHLLAISGLHIGILAGFLWFGCRLLLLSPLSTTLTVIVCLVGYAFLTEGRPSVVRATIMICVAVAGIPWYRRASLGNLLAVAALAILVYNPCDLFDIGAQLSFLAMTAIVWSSGLFRQPQLDGQDTIEGVPTREYGRIERTARAFGERIVKGYLMVALIWLFVSPLVAATFHIFSPIGLGINVLLTPVLAVVLGFGYLFVACGFLIPQAAWIPGTAFDQGLSFLQWSVDAAANVPGGHLYAPGPTADWLAVFYLLLAVCIGGAGRLRLQRWIWGAIVLWIGIGLALGASPPQREGLRCTFLSVGHGCAVLLELPNGSTLLYDAGSLQDGRYAGITVKNALWEYRRRRIDGLILSHGDLDHYNGVPELLKSVPVESVLSAPQFPDRVKTTLTNAVERAAGQRLRFTPIFAPCRLELDETVTLEVLHPRRDARFIDDNAASIVLLIDYAGRRILLTGDLEEEGLPMLLAQRRRKIDVLLAPHHGSRGSNTAEMAQWARPEVVVASVARRDNVTALPEVYGPQTAILTTAERGAVTVEIDAEGELRWSGFRDENE